MHYRRTVFVPFDAHAASSDGSFHAVYYKPTVDRLKQMDEDIAVEEKSEEKLAKDWRENVQLPAKFKTNQPAFLKVLGEFESMWERHLRRINVSNHLTGLLNDEGRLVHSPAYRVQPKGRQFAAAEMNRMVTKKVIEPAATERAAPIVSLC